MKNLVNIIQAHSLTVRCLPYKVREIWSCREGQELKENEELIYWKPDIVYFQKQFSRYEKETAKTRMETFYKKNPLGIPQIHHTRKVEKGGWWYVKEVPNTMSTVRFNRKYDKFFAPTLKEAIDLFLESKKP